MNIQQNYFNGVQHTLLQHHPPYSAILIFLTHCQHTPIGVAPPFRIFKHLKRAGIPGPFNGFFPFIKLTYPCSWLKSKSMFEYGLDFAEIFVSKDRILTLRCHTPTHTGSLNSRSKYLRFGFLLLSLIFSL